MVMNYIKFVWLKVLFHNKKQKQKKILMDREYHATTDLNRHSKISWNIAWSHKEFRKSFLQLVQLSSIYTPTICQIAFAPFQEITTESLNFIKAPYYLPFPYLLVLPKPIYPGSQLVFWSFHSIHHFFFFFKSCCFTQFLFLPKPHTSFHP